MSRGGKFPFFSYPLSAFDLSTAPKDDLDFGVL